MNDHRSMVEGNSGFDYSGGFVDITPESPIALAGYCGAERRSEAVHSRLEANAVCLRAGQVRVLFVAVDLLYAGSDLTDAVHRRAAHYGLPRECVVITASHTHFAPATDRNKPALGRVDDAYLSRLIRDVCGLIDTVMLAEPVRVSAEFGRSESDANVYRRRRWPLPTLSRSGLRLRPSVVMAPNPHGPRDAFIDAIRLVDADGKLVASLWKFGCHPVCFPRSRQISAEYPGVARSALREEFGARLPVVFWQGFAGDVRPRLLGRRSLLQQLSTFWRGPTVGVADEPTWTRWTQRVAAGVILASRAVDASRIPSGIRVTSVQIPLSDLVEWDTPSNPAGLLEIQRIVLGQGPELLILSAEPCAPYLAILAGPASTVFIGYAGDVCGYLPSEAQVREGGYETGEFFTLIGSPGHFKRGFESTVAEAVARARTHSGT